MLIAQTRRRWVVTGVTAVRKSEYSGILTFEASPDHGDVTSYEVRVYDGAVLEDALDIGTPTPDGNNDITVDLTTFFGTIAPGNYTLTVAAISPGGETESAGTDFSLPL